MSIAPDPPLAGSAPANTFTLPQMVAPERVRAPQADIPQTVEERRRVKALLQQYVADTPLTTPLSLDELRRHTDGILEQHPDIDPRYRDYMAVLLNNEAWAEELAGIPYDRRLLLLPKCLRVEDKCPAPFDEFGLLCKFCGLCSIQDLQTEAERLGYAVLVAEGSAIVMAMIQTGQIEAIVGVSCLSVLEKAFPHTEAAAVPSIAIPLLQDDCVDCTVDLDWVWDVVHLSADDTTRRLDLDGLRRDVDGWFARDQLDALLGGATDDPTESLAREWLGKAGKRWRPFLAVCAYWALAELEEDEEAPLTLKKVAVAVECFHKASLVHDDIEDDDATRYGEPSLHEAHGVPVALNVGDLLLGIGYQLLAGCGAPAPVTAELVRLASAGHRTLCLGQGAELAWARDPRPLGSREVLRIFRDKTAPAFGIALSLGATLADADDDVLEVLDAYSTSIGIAYQIKDDLDDLAAFDARAKTEASTDTSTDTSDGVQAPDDVTAQRPTLPMALAHEKAKGDDRALLAAAWRREDGVDPASVRAALDREGVVERGNELLEAYKSEAIRSLIDLHDASLKGLLRRVVGKIFRLEVEGWCSEFEARNAASRAAGAEAAR